MPAGPVNSHSHLILVVVDRLPGNPYQGHKVRNRAFNGGGVDLLAIAATSSGKSVCGRPFSGGSSDFPSRSLASATPSLTVA